MTNFSVDDIKIKLIECGQHSLSNLSIHSLEELMSILKKDKVTYDAIFHNIIFNKIKDIIVEEFDVSPEKIQKNTSIEQIFPLTTRIERMKVLKSKEELELPRLTYSSFISAVTIGFFIFVMYFWFSFLYNNQIIVFVLPGVLKVISFLIIGSIPTAILYFLFPKLFVRNRFDRISTFEDFIEDVEVRNTKKSEELITAYFTASIL